MPYLRFKGFDEAFLRQQQPLLVAEFSRVSGILQESVKIELLPIKRITDTPRSLEIHLFPMDQKKLDAVAENLYDLLSNFGYPDVHIFFVLLSPSLYYQEGQPTQNRSWLPAKH
jgi:hypothetical protein